MLILMHLSSVIQALKIQHFQVFQHLRPLN